MNAKREKRSGPFLWFYFLNFLSLGKDLWKWKPDLGREVTLSGQMISLRGSCLFWNSVGQMIAAVPSPGTLSP